MTRRCFAVRGTVLSNVLVVSRDYMGVARGMTEHEKRRKDDQYGT